MKAVRKSFINEINKYKNKRIVFWGASLFLEEILNTTDFGENNILGIIDNNSQRWNEKISDYEIFEPEKINTLKPKYILISILNLNKDSYMKLKKEIKQKFPKVKILPNVLLRKKPFDISNRLRWLFLLLDNFIPKNKNKITFMSCPDFSDNAKEYYEYLYNNHKEEFDIVWLYNDINSNMQNFVETKSYFARSLKGIWQLLTSKYIVNTVLTTMVYNPKKHVILQLWHGMPLKTLGYIEKNIEEIIFEKYKKYGKYSYFFVSSDIFKLSMISCFYMNPNNIFITGQAKTDCILTNKNKEKIENILDIKKYSKVVIYAPTYKESLRNSKREINKDFNNIFYCDDYSQQEFFGVLEKNNILLIIKPHPLEENFYKKYTATGALDHPNIKIFYDCDMKKNDVYFYDFFKFADLMITDFSSIAIDYLISEKPVIFMNSLSEEYSKNRGFILEDNYELLMPGAKVSTFKQLISAMEDALTIDSWKKERTEKIPLLHKYLDSNSANRIFNVMKNIEL